MGVFSFIREIIPARESFNASFGIPTVLDIALNSVQIRFLIIPYKSGQVFPGCCLYILLTTTLFDLFVYCHRTNPVFAGIEDSCTVQIGCEVRTNMVQGVYQPGHISVQYR